MKISSCLSVISALLLLLGRANSLADCGQASNTITNLPAITYAGYQVYGLNATGQLTGFFYVAFEHASHAFLYDSGTLTDLGTFGGDTSIGYAINNSGQIAGQSDLTDNAQTHAFLYSGVSPLDLGTLGGTWSSALAINDAGQVAGNSLPANGGMSAAFLYNNGALVSLGSLGGGYSYAAAINNQTVVAGESSIASGDTHGFVYSGGMTDVGTLGGTYSTVYALNDAGVAVGISSLADGTMHGFTWVGGTLTDVGTLGGDFSVAFAVNQPGQVIGDATTTDGEYHGFIYTGGNIVDLGSLGGNYSYADAINNLGQVVGEAAAADGTSHAFLWQKGQMLDLNTILPANSGWILNSGLLINDSGRIVGVGTLDGVSQWFIMDVSTGNKPPVAVAGPDQTADCQTQVTLDGSASSDPDKDPLTFQWTLLGTVLGTKPVLSVSLPLGTNVVTLVVTDPCGASSQTNVTVIVSDTQAPKVSCPAPITLVADANCQALVPSLINSVVASDNCTPASLLRVSQTPSAGTAVGSGQFPITVTVTDQANNSTTCTTLLTVVDQTAPVISGVPGPITLSADADCQARVPNVLPSVVASDNCTPANQLRLSQDPAAGTVVGSGQYTITVSAKDAAGNAASATVPLKVVDTTPPIIQAITVNPSVLSPPNHALIPVTVSVAASDNCDPAPVSKIVSITANGPTAPGDIQITGNLTATLAASKNTSGTMRIYTITVQCTDAAGNSSLSTAFVTVPSSNGNGGGTGNKVRIL